VLVDPWEAAALAAARAAIGDLRELARSQERLIGGIAGVIRVLEAVSVERPPATDAGAVLIADALSLRARRVRALFICATQQGVFPAPVAEELFLGASERAQLAQASGLLLSEPTDSLAAERSLFYALCSRPTARLRVSWHLATDDGEAALPSLFVDELRDYFEPSLYDERQTRLAGTIGWPDRRIDSPAARRLAAVLAQPRRAGAVIAALEHPERLLALRGHAPHSPSALERWAGCPVAWFVDRGLRAKALAPDEVPLKRGTVIHDVLALVFAQLREQTPRGRLDSSTLPFALELLEAALAENSTALSANNEIDLTERHRTRLGLRRYLAFAAASASTHDPWLLELAFGTDGDPHPAVELADGALALCGRVDRIDLDPADRTILVYDYKSGVSGVSKAADWPAESRFQQALYMRAMEALLDVEAVGGLYQPLRGKLQPRGAIRDDADPDVEFVKTDRFSPQELEALVDGQLAAAVQAAREIDRGALAPRPPTCAYKHGCQFPTICRAESR
jgi:ATP-dependent helicase/DNAse subunit B